MGLRINQNIAALNAHRNLVATDNALSKSLERLSSGFRINRAADDAAGLAISEKLRAQVRGLAQAIRNAQDGISMIQTAEGALNEVHAMLQRMRELALQAANDTLSAEDRQAINQEIQQLRAEIDNVSGRTTFNGKKLLDGSLVTSLDTSSELRDNLAVTGGGESAFVTKVDVSAARPGTTYTLTGSGTSLTLTRADGVAQTITVSAISAGGSQVLDFSQLGVKITVASSGGITGANLVTALTATANDTITTATGSGSANFQVGPAAGDSISVSFAKVDVAALGLTAALDNFNSSQTVTNAQALVTAVDSAVNTVSTQRGKYGAAQNRLEHTVASLGVAQENMTAAESRIRDADMAQEMVVFTRNQILLQAGTAMLAQANAAPQVVLQLLR
ncbi:MAG: flagellin [Armatimonadota bacterium]|nr:flagellin [Armatimonadota bacterium]MDR7542112.1 flagellin [Armatimonadota bacterium]MDR7577481.1 flagellin [Armatimonadota bacterium]MDR7579747.1 flagellin [Armatimonadota bacterium]MDR7594480.1 flagellin [Armatimonadota bacterium]